MKKIKLKIEIASSSGMLIMAIGQGISVYTENHELFKVFQVLFIVFTAFRITCYLIDFYKEIK